MSKNKLIGFILLAVGVSLCAAASARLTEPVSAALVAKRDLGQRAAAAQAAAEEAQAAAAQAAEAEAEALTAQAAAAQAAAAQAKAVVNAAFVQPKDRLSQWLSAFGALFGVGMALVITGAVLARRAVRAEADQAPATGAEAKAIQVPADLGDMLRGLAARLSELLAAHPAADHLPTDDAQAILRAVESLQSDYLELMTAAPVRARVQLRYGVEGLAALFSPLSAAERRINRAWSALVDRHWPEARASLSEAQAQAAAAAEALQGLKPRA
jgi:hypothetical protein